MQDKVVIEENILTVILNIIFILRYEKQTRHYLVSGYLTYPLAEDIAQPQLVAPSPHPPRVPNLYGEELPHVVEEQAAVE